MRRNQFSEWFVIDKGKAKSAIYSSMFYPDQDALVPNWPPYDGNWPVLPAPEVHVDLRVYFSDREAEHTSRHSPPEEPCRYHRQLARK